MGSNGVGDSGVVGAAVHTRSLDGVGGVLVLWVGLERWARKGRWLCAVAPLAARLTVQGRALSNVKVYDSKSVVAGD